MTRNLKQIIVVFILNIFVLTTFGNFITTSDDTIKDCNIECRTFGKLNKEKSNVAFMPTWFLGTSKDRLFN
jgi:homoserine acetyltransferase